MNIPFSDRSDEGSLRARLRDSFDDADDGIDLSDLDGDFDSGPDDALDGEDLEDTGIDHSFDS